MTESLSKEAQNQLPQKDMTSDYSQFLGRLQASFKHVLVYQNPHLQAKARNIIPIQQLRQNSQGHANPRDEFLRQLLKWFKEEFFKWVDKPKCPNCHQQTVQEGMARPVDSELLRGAGRVELYRCTSLGCGRAVRFPRYNDPSTLLDTREGRCGEWANCFTLCCIATGHDARHVIDWTDHVWTEVWSEDQQRWVHMDPCENSWDSPLMYESGWGKKLSYIFAFSADEIADVARRYTRDFTLLLARRTEVPEAWLDKTLPDLTQQRQQGGQFTPSRLRFLSQRFQNELEELKTGLFRRPEESESHGRTSGSRQWVHERGEDGQ